MQTKQRSNGSDDGMVIWIVLAVVILFGIPALYAANAESINQFLLGLAMVELRPFANFSQEALSAYNKMQALNPSDLTWEQIEAVTEYSGSWIRWPMMAVLGLFCMVAFHLSRTEKLTRRLDMEGLLKHNVQVFPCLFPIVGRGKYLLSPESLDNGFWRTARSPIQFAVEHELLLNPDGEAWNKEEVLNKFGMAHEEAQAFGKSSLDMAKAKSVFQEQLGKTFEGIEHMSPVRQALAAAFLAYAAGNKEKAIQLLDTISLSYKEGIHIPKKGSSNKKPQTTEKDTPPALPSVSIPDKEVQSILKDKATLEILAEKTLCQHNNFELPFFIALINRARRKGVLANSQFLWVRPIDRALWYTLSQCGGRSAWAEAYGPWAHYLAETKHPQKHLTTPYVQSAVSGLADALDKQGWFDTTPAELAAGLSTQHGVNQDLISPELIDAFE